MADIIDKANDVAEIARQAYESQRKPAGPVYTGFCLYCGEPVEHPKRRCDVDHRDSWERENG